jgi:hypothetical protein
MVGSQDRTGITTGIKWILKVSSIGGKYVTWKCGISPDNLEDFQNGDDLLSDVYRRLCFRSGVGNPEIKRST